MRHVLHRVFNLPDMISPISISESFNLVTFIKEKHTTFH